jgi:hypothetical protein
VANLSPIEYSWHRKYASINETVTGIPFLRFLFKLVLSCLGQAADLVVSTTRSSAVGIMLTPPKLERVPTWGTPDHSANRLRLGRRAISALPLCFIALLYQLSRTSTCTNLKEVEVSLTPTLILARRAGSEISSTETRVRAPSPHRLGATSAASIRTPLQVADPSTDPISRRSRGVIQRAPPSLKARHGLVSAVTDRL